MWFSLDTDVGQLISPIAPLAIYLTIAFLIIMENGLVFGFFFPGDVLMLGAGVVAGSYTDIDIRWVVVVSVAASIVGSQIGYWIGRRFGSVLERKANSPGIQKAINLSHKYFEESQGLSVLAANFIPGLRVFIPIIAGNHKMGRVKFLGANIIGSVAWAGIFTVIGYVFTRIDLVQENPLIVLAALFTISSIASIVNFFNSM